MTLTEWLRKNTCKLVNPVADFFFRHGITADQITLIGLLGNCIASLLIFKGKFFTAGLVTLFMIPLDVLDGAVARLAQKTSKFGGLLDSVCDRYAEMALMLGLLFYYLGRGYSLGIIITTLALCGSFLVPYVRARAEGLGIFVKQGIMTRVERSIIFIVALLIKQPLIGVTSIALLANVTAIQRILIARKMLFIEEIGDKND